MTVEEEQIITKLAENGEIKEILQIICEVYWNKYQYTKEEMAIEKVLTFANKFVYEMTPLHSNPKYREEEKKWKEKNGE